MALLDVPGDAAAAMMTVQYYATVLGILSAFYLGFDIGWRGWKLRK